MLKTSQLQLFLILGLLALLMSIACDDTDRLVKAGWNKPTNISPTYVMTSDLDEESLQVVQAGITKAPSFSLPSSSTNTNIFPRLASSIIFVIFENFLILKLF